MVLTTPGETLEALGVRDLPVGGLGDRSDRAVGEHPDSGGQHASRDTQQASLEALENAVLPATGEYLLPVRGLCRLQAGVTAQHARCLAAGLLTPHERRTDALAGERQALSGCVTDHEHGAGDRVAQP